MWPRRSVVGSSSSCCLFGCCAGHSAAGVWGKQSCPNVMICSSEASGDELHQEAMRDAIPSRSHPVGAPTAEKKARMACQKSAHWRSFQEPVSASPALQWLQERTTLFGNCRTDDTRCNAENCPREVCSRATCGPGWEDVYRQFCAVHPGDHLQDPVVARTSI